MKKLGAIKLEKLQISMNRLLRRLVAIPRKTPL